jgi:ATP-dependent Clp protease adapter protein ClpS
MPKIRNAESDADVLTVEEQAVELPRLYRVLLHNDDFTTMDFVVGIRYRGSLDHVESSQ